MTVVSRQLSWLWSGCGQVRAFSHLLVSTNQIQYWRHNTWMWCCPWCITVIQAYLGYCVTPSNYVLYPRIHGWQSVSRIRAIQTSLAWWRRLHNIVCRSMTIEARYAALARSSSPHRNASDIFGSVTGEVCADRNRQVFGMHYCVMPAIQYNTNNYVRVKSQDFRRCLKAKINSTSLKCLGRAFHKRVGGGPHEEKHW
jgi:hypothetical protein